MHDVVRLPLLAAIAAWSFTAAVSAQTPPPSAASPADVAPKAAPVTPWRALERENELEETPAPAREPGTDPAGALGWEIVGGVVPSVAGVTLLVASMAPTGSGGHVPTFHVNLLTLSVGAVLTLAGPPIGVIIAGDATGGTGSAGYTVLGAFSGLILGVPGLVIGSVLGYRLSSDDAVKQAAAEPHASLVPILSRNEVGLQWSGALEL